MTRKQWIIAVFCGGNFTAGFLTWRTIPIISFVSFFGCLCWFAIGLVCYWHGG